MKLAMIFDMGGVLLEWDPRNLYRKLFVGDEAGMEAFLRQIDFYNWNLEQDAGRPFAEGVQIACAQYPQYCQFIQAYDRRWRESIIGPISGSLDIVRALKLAGYPLYGLSNWSAEKFPLVRSEFEFMDWFREIMISGEVRLVKPDPRIFHLLLEHIGFSAQECLLIDDSLHNIKTAQAIGFDTIHFQSPRQLSEALLSRGILEPPLLTP